MCPSRVKNPELDNRPIWICTQQGVIPSAHVSRSGFFFGKMADENSTAAERKQLDWERIGIEYRAGKLSLREIASTHGCSEGAIRKRAKRDGWQRDLAAKIEQAVRSKLVRTEVRAADAATEKEIVEANAQAIINIRLEHRSDIKRAKSLVSKLFTEVEASAKKPEGEEQPVEALSLTQRVDCVRKLTESAKTLITMEREAWGIPSVPDKLVVSREDDETAELPPHVLEMLCR